MTAPRLLFVAPHLRVGGAQRLLSTQIPGLRRRGFGVSLLTLEGEGEFFEVVRDDGVETHCAGMRGPVDLRRLARVLRVPDPRPDVVLTQDVPAHIVGSLIARRAGAAHVAVDHRGPDLAHARHRVAILRALLPRAARVITSTPAKIPQLRRGGVAPERIRIIPNGVADGPPGRSPSRAVLRARLGLADDDFAALLVSVLRPEKRPAGFVLAIAAAHARDPRVRGLVAGDGPERPRVEAAAARANAPVSLLGHRDDVADLMKAADVVCLSSRAEASPLAALEAMAAGRPVIAPDVGGVAEIVADGETGFLIPPGDDAALAAAVLELAADPEHAARLGRAGRRRQREEFGVERMNDSYANALREVAAEVVR